jgi:histidinol dehydrogenase
MQGLLSIGPIATTLATLEGLDAHARAVTERLAAIDALTVGSGDGP